MFSPVKFDYDDASQRGIVYTRSMRATQQVDERIAMAEPIAEEVVILIVVTMLTGMTVVLSGAATIAMSIFSALI